VASVRERGPATRTATIDDVAAIRAILAAHGDDAPVTQADIVGPYLHHLLAHHRVLVAEEADLVVGFGAVVDAGVADHLSDLFVRPDRLGHGVGGALLAALFDDPRGRGERSTFASADPRALPIYVRAGLVPWWVSLYLEGETARLPIPPGLEIEGADAARLAALELAWTEADRSADHAFWASQAGADPFLVADASGPVAVGCARTAQASPIRALERLVIRPGVDPVGPVIAALRRTGSGPAGATRLVHATVPGPHPALRPLLEHGMRIVDRDQFMATAAGLVDPSRLLPSGGML
jgi:GNAT superfamily N-acetyltransferase